MRNVREKNSVSQRMEVALRRKVQVGSVRGVKFHSLLEFSTGKESSCLQDPQDRLKDKCFEQVLQYVLQQILDNTTTDNELLRLE